MTARTSTRSVTFDKGPLGTGTLFRDAREVIEVWEPEGVAAAFDQLSAAQADGKWLAGVASYELGFALVSKLAPRMPEARKEPLLQFGVFDAPEAPTAAPNTQGTLGPFTPAWSFAAYEAAFDQLQAYIRAGDVYQGNLTMPLTAQMAGAPEAVYAALCRKQPVPYGALVDLGQTVLLSRSPELFFGVTAGGQATARPMKGTIHRGDEDYIDHTLKTSLAHSEKNQAENLMITDLLRNDLGRISEIGSVKVPKLFEIESYNTVHQMVSEITSQLVPGLSLYDIFKALFPCGSITGAPKIRAMEILSDLEDTPRGSYCGGIGWVAPDGAMEFNVAIRTLICDPSGQVTLNVGGGIVHDSTAQSEYDEALLKARFATDLPAL